MISNQRNKPFTFDDDDDDATSKKFSSVQSIVSSEKLSPAKQKAKLPQVNDKPLQYRKDSNGPLKLMTK